MFYEKRIFDSITNIVSRFSRVLVVAAFKVMKAVILDGLFLRKTVYIFEK